MFGWEGVAALLGMAGSVLSFFCDAEGVVGLDSSGSATVGSGGRLKGGGGPIEDTFSVRSLVTFSGVNSGAKQLFVLNVLPPDFVLALDQIFSANDAARLILPVLFLGDNDGHDIPFPVPFPICPNSLRGVTSAENSVLWSGGVAAGAESSDETSEDMEILCLAGPFPSFDDRETLPSLRKLANLDLGDLEGNSVGLSLISVGVVGRCGTSLGMSVFTPNLLE